LERFNGSASAANLASLEPGTFWQQTTGLSTYLESYFNDSAAFPPFETSSGKRLLLELEELVRERKDASCVLLIGHRGIGKTEVLRQVRAKLSAPEHWIHFDGSAHSFELFSNRSSIISAVLTEVAQSVRGFLEKNKLPDSCFVDDVFQHDPVLGPVRLLFATATPQRKRALVNEVRVTEPAYFLQACLRFLIRRFAPGRLLLVLDNMDSFPIDLQAKAIELASGLAESLKIVTIVSIRRTTAQLLLHRDPEVMRATLQKEVPSPRMAEILNQLRTAVRASPEGQIKDLPRFVVVQIIDFLVECFSDERVEALLAGLSNERVGEALLFIREALRSPHLNGMLPVVSEDRQSLSPPPKGKPEYRWLVRSMMLGDRQVYDPEASLVANAFGTLNSGTHMGPFLRVYIVLVIQEYQDRGISEAELCKTLSTVLEADRQDCEQEITWLLEKAWLERTELGHLNTTPRGRFFVNEFIYETEYLSQIAPDVDMFSVAKAALLTPPTGLDHKGHNMAVLLKYLLSCEKKMFEHISRDGLRDYSEIFGLGGLTEGMISEVLSNQGHPMPEDGKGRSRKAMNSQSSREKIEGGEWVVRDHPLESLKVAREKIDIPDLIRTFGGKGE
jgi:hypothetical protein